MEGTINISELMREKAEAGFLVGPPKLGFQIIRTNAGSQAVPDPCTAPLVARAFVEVAANGLSLRKVTALLRKEGLRGQRGKLVTLPTVHRFLTDPYYGRLVPDSLFELAQRKLAGRRTTTGTLGTRRQ